MTVLLALLGIGALGAAGSAWGLARGGRAARLGAVGGALALLVVAILAFGLDTVPASRTQLAGGGVLAGRLAANGYLRLVVALWALDATLVTFVAWLSGGLRGIRGLLPATLAAIVGGTVALAATDLTLGAAAAGAAGLAALVALVAAGRPGVVAASYRELRISLLGPVLLIAAAAAAPVAAALVLRGVSSDVNGPAAGPGEAGALMGLLALTIALAIAVRTGVIPFHVRVPRLADAAPPLALPLLLAWIPIPLSVVGLNIVDQLLAPLALPHEGETSLVVAVVLFTLLAAALAAFLQDDIRHAVGYLVIADGALILLGLAALDTAAWGPARTWLIVFAASKTAVIAWSAVAEARFETRSVPDLRGWLRRSPILGAALVVATVATFGIPGWVAFTARGDLASLGAGSPWDAVLILAAFATLPTYLRLLVLGTGPATSAVSRAAPERIVRGWRPEVLPVEREGSLGAPGGGQAAAGSEDPAGASGGRATEDGGGEPSEDGPSAGVAGRTSARSRPLLATASASASDAMARGARLVGRLTTAMRRDGTELTAAAVLALAILAALTSWGALDIAGAAAQPAPIVAGPSSD